jgi:hypothetical protein
MGRWPANVIMDDEAAAILDTQSGELKAGVAVRHRSGGNTFGGSNAKPPMDDMGYGDSGGASRFFTRANSRAEVTEWLIRLITPPGGAVLMLGVNRNANRNTATEGEAK